MICYQHSPFNISRNILYLSPGDDLKVYLTPDTRQASYQGKGSEANIFLKDRLYPKGGSFLLSGRNIGPDFQATRRRIDSLAEIKLQQLEKLQQVSPEFKENERARIWANLINSYLMYPMYNRELRGMSAEEAEKWEQDFRKEITPAINAWMETIARNKYLDIVDVREVVIYQLEQASFFQHVAITPEMREIQEALKVLSVLDASTDAEEVKKIEKTLDSYRNQEIAASLREKIEGVKSLMAGQPAHDIVMSDTTGVEVRLSSFKGRPIYLDCWATWCGPCIQESPAFAALSKKYEGKDLVFIQLSTDNSRKDWLNYLAQKKGTLTQYNSTDHVGLRERWQIKYIPRFILIDRDFNIFRAFAPRPSDPDITVCLEELLKR